MNPAPYAVFDVSVVTPTVVFVCLVCCEFLFLLYGLQCFDAVGWAAGRASGL